MSDMVEQRGDIDLFTVSVCIAVFVIIGFHFSPAALAAIRAADGSVEQVQFAIFGKLGQVNLDFSATVWAVREHIFIGDLGGQNRAVVDLVLNKKHLRIPPIVVIGIAFTR